MENSSDVFSLWFHCGPFAWLPTIPVYSEMDGPEDLGHYHFLVFYTKRETNMLAP